VCVSVGLGLGTHTHTHTHTQTRHRHRHRHTYTHSHTHTHRVHSASNSSHSLIRQFSVPHTRTHIPHRLYFFTYQIGHSRMNFFAGFAGLMLPPPTPISGHPPDTRHRYTHTHTHTHTHTPPTHTHQHTHTHERRNERPRSGKRRKHKKQRTHVIKGLNTWEGHLQGTVANRDLKIKNKCPYISLICRHISIHTLSLKHTHTHSHSLTLTHSHNLAVKARLAVKHDTRARHVVVRHHEHR